MKPLRILLIFFICTLLINTSSGIIAYSESSSVQVTIPTANVELNHDIIDSQYQQYPLIVYQNITYFPLTWDWCNKLGLIIGYTADEGLYIDNYTAYNSPEITTPNGVGHYKKGRGYTASIPTYAIHINGKSIDNASEDYPLLNFQGITYFPLTWDYVVNEFGWDMSLSNEGRLKLNSQGDLIEYGAGEHYKGVSSYILESFHDYSVIQKVTTHWVNGTESDEFGNYVHYNDGQSITYYKLDYAADKLSELDYKSDSDTPYNSGAVPFKSIDDQFTVNDDGIYYNGALVMSQSDDLVEGKHIDEVRATLYSVNGFDIYALSVLYSQNGEHIPAPYTPENTYVFFSKNANTLNQVKNWPEDQVFSNVFPMGKDGIYLCSNARIFGSARFSNGRGWIMSVDATLTENCLNERWKDWNSLVAIGMDNTGALYLKNTWFPEFALPEQYYGSVSAVNDGFFKLNTEDELIKIYPFVEASTIVVTPLGDIYIDEGWTNAILHLQTGTRLEP